MDVVGAMEVGVDRDHAIERLGEESSDDLLTDRLVLVKRSVLPHVAEIRRDQNQPLGAVAPQGLGGEQQRQELLVRPIQRRIDRDDRRRWRHAHTQLRVRKSVNVDCIRRNAQTRGKAAGVIVARWQALNRKRAHGLVSSCVDGVSPSIR